MVNLLENRKVVGKDVVQNIPVHYEFHAGDIKRGKSRDGNEWEQKMHSNYGFVPNTKAPDGDSIDVYVNPKAKKDALIYVIHQLIPDGSKWDEDKAMIGFKSSDEAKEMWSRHIHKPKEMFGGICEFDSEHFLLMVDKCRKGKTILAKHDVYQDMIDKKLLTNKIKSPVSDVKINEVHELSRILFLAGMK